MWLWAFRKRLFVIFSKRKNEETVLYQTGLVMHGFRFGLHRTVCPVIRIGIYADRALTDTEPSLLSVQYRTVSILLSESDKKNHPFCQFSTR